MGELLPLTAEDGHTLAGYRAAPQGKAARALQGAGHKVGVVGYSLGGAIAEHAQEKPRCPVVLHWGETDQSIPPDHGKKTLARTRTLDFLKQHLV